MLSNMTHCSDFLLTRRNIFFSDFFPNLHPMISEEIKKDTYTAWGFWFTGTTVDLFLFTHLACKSSAWKRSYVEPTFYHR